MAMACTIRVRLFFHYQEHAPGGRGEFNLDLEPGTKLEQVVGGLGLPEEAKVVLVNGRQAEPGQIMQANDLLVVFPPIEGG